MVDVVIVGGGLAGLINAILLQRAGLKVTLLEKNRYPFHRVCGEYVSNEVIPFLEKHALFPAKFSPSSIDRLEISSVSGKSFSNTLDLGGFGISRYVYDHWLAEKAKACGVDLREGNRANDIFRRNGNFAVLLESGEEINGKLVIAAHGKRAKIDQRLSRSFLENRSPFVGIKYHAHLDFPVDTIALHNFEGGYCGVSKIENNTYNICYLIHRDQIKKHGSIDKTEEQVLSKNKHLGEILRNAERVFERPEVINEISFERKEPVFQNLLMSGDAAGMITPLCGNGMAMAIHSAKILSDCILEHRSSNGFALKKLSADYTLKWNNEFALRLWVGRKIQSTLFGSTLASEAAVFTGRNIKWLANFLIRQTHGHPFS